MNCTNKITNFGNLHKFIYSSLCKWPLYLKFSHILPHNLSYKKNFVGCFSTSKYSSNRLFLLTYSVGLNTTEQAGINAIIVRYISKIGIMQ